MTKSYGSAQSALEKLARLSPDQGAFREKFLSIAENADSGGLLCCAFFL